MLKLIGIALAGFAALFLSTAFAYSFWVNPRVAQELREDPQGERAKTVMLLTLPSGKSIPVNYLHEGDTVYASSDFTWWRELRPNGGRGNVLIRGETLHGHIRAVENDPTLRESVFARLRPTMPEWAGTLVVIDLE